MISVVAAIIFTSLGFILALIGATYGVIIHLRWLDRKLYRPYPKKQPPPQVKP